MSFAQYLFHQPVRRNLRFDDSGPSTRVTDRGPRGALRFDSLAENHGITVPPRHLLDNTSSDAKVRHVGAMVGRRV